MTRLRFRLVAGGMLVAASVNTASAQGDVVHGKFVFKSCAACHTETERAKVGPGLSDVFGRTAGSVRGFSYSRAMIAWGQIWDDQTLDTFLGAPAETIPGTTMTVGLPGAQDRADVIAYLKTLSGE